MITAEQAARALVGACNEFGVDPLRVFEPENRSARQLAAERCVTSGAEAHLSMLERVFQVKRAVREPAGAAA